MSRVYLFVYGTLRKDVGLKLLESIADRIVFDGEGTVEGTLYDLGSYPAAVKTNRLNRVKGDIYAVQNAEAVFTILDPYEGEAYQREITGVKKESGELIEAFIYWYTGEISKALLIEENDYLDYLKNKKDRFV